MVQPHPSPTFSFLATSLCISHSSTTKLPKVPCGHEAFHFPVSMHMLLPLSGTCLPPAPAYPERGGSSSAKKPFPDTYPPLPANLQCFTSAQSLELVYISRIVYKYRFCASLLLTYTRLLWAGSLGYPAPARVRHCD